MPTAAPKLQKLQLPGTVLFLLFKALTIYPVDRVSSERIPFQSRLLKVTSCRMCYCNLEGWLKNRQVSILVLHEAGTPRDCFMWCQLAVTNTLYVMQIFFQRVSYNGTIFITSETTFRLYRWCNLKKYIVLQHFYIIFYHLKYVFLNYYPYNRYLIFLALLGSHLSSVSN